MQPKLNGKIVCILLTEISDREIIFRKPANYLNGKNKNRT